MIQGKLGDAVPPIAEAARGASGGAIILSPNPMHDTGGGQRSAQLARELLARDFFVAFLAHGEVSETQDLGDRFEHPRLAHLTLGSGTGEAGRRALASLFEAGPTLALGEVPVAQWLPTLRAVSRAGGVGVYDLIDDWDSELGYGWYERQVEARVARASDVLVASAPVLTARLERITGRPAHLLPNAFNQRIFRAGSHPRAPDLPSGKPIALYVGSLWGRWMDWTLVRRIATDAPDVALVFVGDYRGEGGELPDNCHFLGLKPQSTLPGYVAHAQVGILPWSVNPVTQATSPLKVYEFLALGLPVVTPPLDPLAHLPGVHAAAGPDAFVGAVRRLARDGAPDAERSAMATFSAQNSWAARVDTLLALTTEAAERIRDGRAPKRGSRFRWWPWK